MPICIHSLIFQFSLPPKTPPSFHPEAHSTESDQLPWAKSTWSQGPLPHLWSQFPCTGSSTGISRMAGTAMRSKAISYPGRLQSLGVRREVICLYKNSSFSLRCGSGAPLLSSPSSGGSGLGGPTTEPGSRCDTDVVRISLELPVTLSPSPEVYLRNPMDPRSKQNLLLGQ